MSECCTVTEARTRLHARIRALIERLGAGGRDDAARDALLVELAAFQRAHVAPYARYAEQRLRGRAIESADDVPALPTDAFRHARIARHAPEHDVRTFRSSGTTADARSLHPLADLSLYDAAAERAARHALFPDCERMTLVILAPPEDELPDSSLSYMLARFVTWFGDEGSRYVWPLGPSELASLVEQLERASREAKPVALLGTSFAFVHALDALGARRFALPPGSRVMQTGGFKGRSREVAPDAMRALLCERFGIAEPFVIAEYGMTELSSQLYEDTLCRPASSTRRLWAPGWVRVRVVDPETLAPLPDGQEGLVRIDDLANLDSVAGIQTADLGVMHEGGLELRGRAPAAVARGCSIRADELLGGGRA